MTVERNGGGRVGWVGRTGSGLEGEEVEEEREDDDKEEAAEEERITVREMSCDW